MSGKRYLETAGNYLEVKRSKLDVGPENNQRYAAVPYPIRGILRTEKYRKSAEAISYPTGAWAVSCWANIIGGYPDSVFNQKYDEIPDDGLNQMTGATVQQVKFIRMAVVMMPPKY